MTNEMLQTNDPNTAATLTIRLLVAMEMSLKTWRLVMSPEGGTRKRVETVEAGNFLELEQAVADARERFKLPARTPLVFCYEAGRDGFYPYRRLTGAGHEVWVIDSASIEVSRRQRQAKPGGIDGEELAELMRRKARGGQKALRIARVPPPEAEDERLLPRERESLLHAIDCAASAWPGPGCRPARYSASSPRRGGRPLRYGGRPARGPCRKGPR